MKKFSCLFLLLSFFWTGLQAQSLKTKADSVAYSMGIMLAQSLQRQGFENMNADVLAQAIEHTLNGKELLIREAQASALVNDHKKELSAKKHDKAIQEGKAFLAQNSKNKKITTLPSGLQYEVLTKGDGPKPKLTDKVTTHYHGMLVDGTVFDSSVERGSPTSFPVNGVIKGWQEALQLMNTGSKWKLYIPYDLAYGERGAGSLIKPFATLVFEVELLSIN